MISNNLYCPRCLQCLPDRIIPPGTMLGDSEEIDNLPVMCDICDWKGHIARTLNYSQAQKRAPYTGYSGIQSLVDRLETIIERLEESLEDKEPSDGLL